MCYDDPMHLNTPPYTMIPILVDSASASSIVCVVNMTALFFLLCDILYTTFHMCLLASGSIPADGSSSNIIGGFPNVASATDSFLLFPPDNVPAGLYLWLVRLISII
jgi:hypothetical protein